jgi:UDP-N-acetylglucosamine--N-acetylmuramyl-(pentapeptide) pyrophosphoryl-undecaprenol N-acetylglucosamine transferase
MVIMPKSSGILFCGGGTGGHVLPGLAVVQALREKQENTFRWIGDPARIEATLVPQAGIRLLPYGLSRPRPHNPLWLLSAARQAWNCFNELRRSPPRVIVALGGYAALLPGLMAPILRRPLVVMEQNARSGRTNRLLARFAQAIVTQFPEARVGMPGRRVAQLGNPVRPIHYLPRGHAPTLRVLIAGGSLAAKSLNDVIVAAAPALAKIPGLSLTHLAGEADRERVAQAYAAAGLTAEVLGFCHDMPALYDRTDVAITRAGATTVAELCAAGIPALYIPLPWAADDHQTANAQAVTRLGGAVVVQQTHFTADYLVSFIAQLVHQRARVSDMGLAAHQLARPHAAMRVAELVCDVQQKKRALFRQQRRQHGRQHFRHQLASGGKRA